MEMYMEIRFCEKHYTQMKDEYVANVNALEFVEAMWRIGYGYDKSVEAMWRIGYGYDKSGFKALDLCQIKDCEHKAVKAVIFHLW
jgi:hypothetical protein